MVQQNNGMPLQADSIRGRRTVGQLPTPCGENAFIRALFNVFRIDGAEGLIDSFVDSKQNSLPLPRGVSDMRKTIL
jgi:hypothetical protein